MTNENSNTTKPENSITEADEASPVTAASPENPYIARPDLVKKIGGTVYEVAFHFNSAAKETFLDKIIRLIRRDLQNL